MSSDATTLTEAAHIVFSGYNSIPKVYPAFHHCKAMWRDAAHPGHLHVCAVPQHDSATVPHFCPSCETSLRTRPRLKKTWAVYPRAPLQRRGDDRAKDARA